MYAFILMHKSAVRMHKGEISSEKPGRSRCSYITSDRVVNSVTCVLTDYSKNMALNCAGPSPLHPEIQEESMELAGLFNGRKFDMEAIYSGKGDRQRSPL